MRTLRPSALLFHSSVFPPSPSFSPSFYSSYLSFFQSAFWNLLSIVITTLHLSTTSTLSVSHTHSTWNLNLLRTLVFWQPTEHQSFSHTQILWRRVLLVPLCCFQTCNDVKTLPPLRFTPSSFLTHCLSSLVLSTDLISDIPLKYVSGIWLSVFLSTLTSTFALRNFNIHVSNVPILLSLEC